MGRALNISLYWALYADPRSYYWLKHICQITTHQTKSYLLYLGNLECYLEVKSKWCNRCSCYDIDRSSTQEMWCGFVLPALITQGHVRYFHGAEMFLFRVQCPVPSLAILTTLELHVIPWWPGPTQECPGWLSRVAVMSGRYSIARDKIIIIHDSGLNSNKLLNIVGAKLNVFKLMRREVFVKLKGSFKQPRGQRWTLCRNITTQITILLFLCTLRTMGIG